MCIISKNHNVNLHLYGILQDNIQFRSSSPFVVCCGDGASIDPAS